MRDFDIANNEVWSLTMRLALVDISMDYQGDNSPRWGGRTFAALRRHLVVTGTISEPVLTQRGHKYAHAFLFDVSYCKLRSDERKKPRKQQARPPELQ